MEIFEVWVDQVKKCFKNLHYLEKTKYQEPKFASCIFELMKFLKSKF